MKIKNPEKFVKASEIQAQLMLDLAQVGEDVRAKKHTKESCAKKLEELIDGAQSEINKLKENK